MLTDHTLGWIGDLAKVLIGAIAGALITRRVEGSVKLITRWGHIASFTSVVEGNTVVVNTHEVVVRNAGKRPAHNLRVTHNHLPQFNISPSLPYSIEDLPDGRKDIVFPVVPPGQQLTIAYLYTAPLLYSQIHAGIRSDEALPVAVAAELQRVFPKWWNWVAAIIFMIGCVAILDLLWRLATWVGL